MSILRRLFGAGSEADRAPAGQSDGDDIDPTTATEATFETHADRQRVTVWLRVHDVGFENEREQQRVFELENRIMVALDVAAVGEHDTNTLEPGYFAMRLIGDDAEAIVGVVTPLLSSAPAGSYLAIRHGPAGTAEDRIEVGESADDKDADDKDADDKDAGDEDDGRPTGDLSSG